MKLILHYMSTMLNKTHNYFLYNSTYSVQTNICNMLAENIFISPINAKEHKKTSITNSLTATNIKKDRNQAI